MYIINYLVVSNSIFSSFFLRFGDVCAIARSTGEKGRDAVCLAVGNIRDHTLRVTAASRLGTIKIYCLFIELHT